MPAGLCFHCVLVGRESARFHDDFEPLLRRAVKTNHEQVEIGRQRVHHYYLFLFCANKPGSLRQQKLVVWHPGHFPSKVTFDSVFPPVFHLMHQSFLHTLRLQAERVAAEVEHVFALVFWEKKPFSVNAERVVAVEPAGEGKGIFKFHDGGEKLASKSWAR
jgi:hypothetical protein